MEIRHHVIVVGAGPAGLNAAKHAANAGCDVGLIDAGTRLGGQYWRHTGNENFDQSVHNNFDQGSLLMDAVKNNPRITIYSQSSIWSASVIDREIVLRIKNGSFITTNLILATGAYDRSLPFPGWDIPGVMTAGAAQSLLKGNGIVAGKKIIVAGSGPFLLPVASTLSSHGCESIKVLEATSRFAWRKGLWVMLQNPAKVLEGIIYLLTLRKNKVSIGYNQAIVEAHAGAEGLLQSVTVAQLDSNFVIQSKLTLECDVAAISWGFTPDTSLATSLNVEQKIDRDGSNVVVVDDNQRANTSHQAVNIFAAGEITGVGGSDLALLEGAIAGLAAANAVEQIKKLKSLRGKARRFSKALQRVYVVPFGWKSWLTPKTLICRCEEVEYQQVEHAVQELGAADSRGIKLMTRCGMGLCQGRTCSRIVADLLGSGEEDRLRSSLRPVISPITLGELAQEGLL